MLLMTIITLSTILCALMYTLLTLLGKEAKKTPGGMSPFECGFDSLGNARVPLSLRFFILIVLFLIFDVEIILIVPFIMFNSFNLWYYSGLIMIFIVLIAGLTYEWSEGSLSWLK